MRHKQLDIFDTYDIIGPTEEFDEMYNAIKEIDPNINVVAIYCNIIKSFIVEEQEKLRLYIFNDFVKLDSFRDDNWTFNSIPNNFIKV